MKNDKNTLQRVYDKTIFALTMIEDAKSNCRSEDSLWYNAIAILNAYYALREELSKCSGSDPELKKIIRNWFFDNSKDLNSFFGNARNTITHQGEVETYPFNTWVADHFNDTDRPIPNAFINIKDTEIKNINIEQFLELSEKAFIYLKNGIQLISKNYSVINNEHTLITSQKERWKNAFGDEKVIK